MESTPNARRFPTPFLRLLRAALFLSCLCTGAAHAGGDVRVLEFDGAVGPASADLIIRSLHAAEADGASLFVIEMDTPGGLDLAMRDIIKAILDSKVPVATWVAPGGARAASAGTYILYASHIAAMAPATNLGAATPVSLGGDGGLLPTPPSPDDGAGGKSGQSGDHGKGGTDGGADVAPADAGEASVHARKAVNDAVAYIRSLAELRGRNADWAESAVRASESLSASAALKLGVIDLIAPDLDALLKEVDGRTVELADGPRTLATAGAAVVRVEPDWRSRVLAVLTDPNIAYILLLVGVYGLILEFYSPGVGVAGVTGVICLLLGAYALQMLPVNFAGLGLLGVGIALMVTEAFTPSFGAFGVGGAVAFVIGSVMLIDSDLPAYRVSLAVIAAFAVASLAICMLLVGAALRARARPAVSGREVIIGARAVAAEDFDGAGHVRMQGELWQARSTAAVRRGEVLEVTGRDGLCVTVAPVADDPEIARS